MYTLSLPSFFGRGRENQRYPPPPPPRGHLCPRILFSLRSLTVRFAEKFKFGVLMGGGIGVGVDWGGGEVPLHFGEDERPNGFSPDVVSLIFFGEGVSSALTVRFP